MFKYNPHKEYITFNQKPVKSPWGGGNQWLLGFVQYLKKNGYRVNYKLGRKSICVFIVNSKGLIDSRWRSRKANHITFGIDELNNFKLKYPGVQCIQRVNDTGIHRGNNTINDIFQKVNELCDHTVFISSWVHKYHSKVWWNDNKPYSVINNSADSSIFSPVGGSIWDKKEPFKIVTHHWSSNFQKGFETYKRLDDLIDEGVVKNTELYIVGNYPKEIKWKSAKLVSPLFGIEMANMLRSCHTYITASKHEASGMHWIEGVQCGLPLLFSREGGAVADLGKTYGVSIDNDLPAVIKDIKNNYDEYRQSVLENLPDSKIMYSEYLMLMSKMV